MEVIQLTDRFTIVHLTAGEFISVKPFTREQLFVLYRIVFGKSSEEFKKLNLWHSNAPGTVHYYLGIDCGNLVSFNYYLRFDGKLFSYALSGGSFTHPEHKGSFLPLFQHATKSMLQNTQLLMGFCNDNSFRVFCHPVNRWQEITSFRQYRLIQPIKEYEQHFPYIAGLKSDAVSSSLILFPLRRDQDYISWRLSNIPDADILLNAQTGMVAVLKRFQHSMDVITILNCKTAYEYVDELSGLFAHYQKQNKDFEGLNVYVSFHETETILSERFLLIPNPHERHLCIKSREAAPLNFSLAVEMIDADLF